MSLIDDFDAISGHAPPKKRRIAAPVDTVRLKDDIGWEQDRRREQIQERTRQEKDTLVSNKFARDLQIEKQPEIAKLRGLRENILGLTNAAIGRKASIIAAKQDTLNQARKALGHKKP